MAILQSTLAEEILSRQQRAIVRSIVKASQLNEALVILNKVTEVNYAGQRAAGLKVIHSDNVIDIQNYLISSINEVLTNTKVPAPVKTKLNSTSASSTDA